MEGSTSSGAMRVAAIALSLSLTNILAADPGSYVAAAEKALGDDARDLVFVPITPCTVWDTRYAADTPSSGAISDGQTRRFYSHADGSGGDFSASGGNPACVEANQSFIGARPFAVVMTVYVSDITSNGWLTFYRDGDPDPSNATISVYYSPGPTKTQTVIAKSSRGYGSGSYDVAVTSRYGSANAAASVVGYFVKPQNINLAHSSVGAGNVLKDNVPFLHDGGGSYNVFLGNFSGNFTNTGAGNVGLGMNSLTRLTSGDGNTALGTNALWGLTSGDGNTAVGSAAANETTSGRSNTAIGSGALEQNSAGNYNVAIGDSAMGVATGGLSANTALGSQALLVLNGGTDNVAIGMSALSSLSTGSSNIVIGSSSGAGLQNGSNNIYIGRGPAGSSVESDAIRIGTFQGGGLAWQQTRAHIAAVWGTPATTGAVPVLIDSYGQLSVSTSSARYKDAIADMGDLTEMLMRLRPVTFHYKSRGDRDEPLQFGLVAEEVAEAAPALVARNARGEPETVMYQFLPPMLLNEYQKQQRTIEAQAEKIRALEALAAGLQEKIEAIYAKLGAH